MELSTRLPDPRGHALLDTQANQKGVALLLFRCAKTVSELDLLKPPGGYLLGESRLPWIVVNIRLRRKAYEAIGSREVPCSQVGGSSGKKNRSPS